MAEDQTPTAEGAAKQPQQASFQIQRVFMKDMSFETPNSPQIFAKEWKPEIKLDLDTRSKQIDTNMFEVILAVTVTATLEGETAFLCEVQQAGIFGISDVPEQNMPQMLGSYCPNMLFPYAREAISSMVNRGTFPPLNLAPVNFDAIFAAYVQKRQQEAAAAQTTQKLDA